VAGFLLVVLNLWEIFAGRAVASFPDIVTGSSFLLAAIGAALALLGPGAWSVDSRLFAGVGSMYGAARTELVCPEVLFVPRKSRSDSRFGGFREERICGNMNS
jgi:hypothetical protein